MAENGLINRTMMDNPNPLYQSAVNDAQNGRMDSIMEMAMPPIAVVGGGGGQQFDEGVNKIAMAFKNYLTNNPHADPESAFSAGVDFGRSQGEGMGLPTGAEEFVPPKDEFGPDVAPIPGMGTETEAGFRTQTPYDKTMGGGFSINPQGVPGQIQSTEDFRIDMSDILGTPRG